MSGNSDNLRSGIENVLGPVIDRLRKEAEADLRIAKEDFSRELAEIRRKQQAAFFTTFALFLVICGILVGGTWMSLERMAEDAQARESGEAARVERLGTLEEETRARLDSLISLERRMRVDLLEKDVKDTNAGETADSAAQPTETQKAGE